MRKFGKYGKTNGELSVPLGISVDSVDVVYVSEWDNHRISVFTCEGKFLTSFGTFGCRPGEFINPCGIAIYRDGVVCISDKRLQFF